MRLREYFVGERFLLRSPLRTEEVTKRVNAAAGSPLWPFAEGVKGRIFLGRLRLSFTDLWWFDFNAKPILAGTLQDNRGSCEILAKFRAPVWVYFFYLFWYVFLMLLCLLIVTGALNGNVESSNWALVPTIALFFVAPVVMHYAFNRRAHEQLDSILHFLEQEAELSVA